MRRIVRTESSMRRLPKGGGGRSPTASGRGRLGHLDQGQGLLAAQVVAVHDDVPADLQIAEPDLLPALHDRRDALDVVGDAFVVRALDRDRALGDVDGLDVARDCDVRLLLLARLRAGGMDPRESEDEAGREKERATLE